MVRDGRTKGSRLVVHSGVELGEAVSLLLIHSVAAVYKFIFELFFKKLFVW